MLKNSPQQERAQRRQLQEKRRAIMQGVISAVLWLGFAVSLYLLYTT